MGLRQLLLGCKGLCTCEAIANSDPDSSLGGSYTYQPACPVVVKVHQGSGILSLPFLGIHEGSGKFDPIVNVIAAATPVETALAVLGGSLLLWITGTGF